MGPEVSATATTGEPSDVGAPRIEGTFKNRLKVIKAKGNFTESPVGETYSSTMSFTPECDSGACKTEVKATGSSNYLAVAHPSADGTYSWKAPGVPLQCGTSKQNVLAQYKPSKKTVSITPVAGSDGTVAAISGTITNEWRRPTSKAARRPRSLRRLRAPRSGSGVGGPPRA